MKHLICLAWLCCITLLAQAQDPLAAYEKNIYVSTQGDTLRYRLLRPEKMEAGKKYPLVLFLHGSGERGSDNEKQLIHGGQMWLNPVNREERPAFVVAPQCPDGQQWAYNERPQSLMPDQMPIQQEPAQAMRLLRQLMDELLAMSQVDSHRVYVMGLSMGGMGTYDMAIRYPELFAAAIPICGTVNPSRLAAARQVHFRIYHGDADPTVPVEGSRQAYRALKRAGAEVEYIEFPSMTHGSWVPAFNDPEFMKWLFRQVK